jgi:hypothetical protein
LCPDVVVALPGVAYLLTCSWGSCSEFLLLTSSSGGVGVPSLQALFACFSILRWYIRRDDQDLAIYGLELFSWIVQGDSCEGNLEREAVRRRLPVHLAAIGRSKRSSKLLEDTALASRVFGVLVNRVGFVEVTPAVSTIWCLGSRLDLELALHVA